MKRFMKWCGVGFFGLLCVVVFNTVRFTPPNLPKVEITVPKVDSNVVAQKLSQAIQFKTVSHPLGKPGRPAAYKEFIEWLEAEHQGQIPHQHCLV